MKEINLIVSQEKLNQNRKNTLLKDETKKYQKKQENLKKVCIGMMIGLIIVYIIGLIWVFEINLKQEGYNNCIENGYSEAYCLKHS